MKKIYLALMCMVSLVIMTACGGNSNKKAIDGTTKTETEAKSDSKKWPVTEYTKLIPQPKGISIYEEHAIAEDNPYFSGHQITVTDWSIENCKAYAEELKKAGFTTPGAGSDDVVVKDDDMDYAFGAKNSDGVYVTIGTHNGKSGSISIQVKKQ